MDQKIRIWDLPTRLFHWSLAAAVFGLVITAKVGGNAMVWHLRLGYVVLALLVFRVLWGLVGGRWSRFSSFLYSPARLLHYIQGRGHAQDNVGHNPLGALSVFGLLGVLAAQVGTGLFSDDEIDFAGPLTRFVSSSVVGQATSYHKEIGQYLVIGLVVLHLLAIAFYVLKKKHTLIRPMLDGHKALPGTVEPSRDTLFTRLLALVALGAGAALAWWLASLAAF